MYDKGEHWCQWSPLPTGTGACLPMLKVCASVTCSWGSRPIVEWQWWELLELENRSGFQNLIPDVGKQELAYIPVEGWIIDPYEHGFHDGPGNAMCLLAHSGKNCPY